MPVRLAVARTSGLGERCLPGFANLKAYSEKKTSEQKRRGADDKGTKKV